MELLTTANDDRNDHIVGAFRTVSGAKSSSFMKIQPRPFLEAIVPENAKPAVESLPM
jgi:hypothetical protein